MDIQKLYSLTRQAISKYGLIDEGDKIAVGLSGGKDSIALLYALAGLRKFYPKKFQVVAITVDLGLNMDFSPMEALANELKVEYHIVKTEIYNIVFNNNSDRNHCSLCAKLRKGALNDEAVKMGCNKVAYAHHKDDFVDTFFMSLTLEGRIHTLSPMFELEGSSLTLIRPLFLISEAEIIGFRNKIHFPVIENLCPNDGNTKRQEIKELIKQLSQNQPDIRSKTFSAICNAGFEDWPEVKNDK